MQVNKFLLTVLIAGREMFTHQLTKGKLRWPIFKLFYCINSTSNTYNISLLGVWYGNVRIVVDISMGGGRLKIQFTTSVYICLRGFSIIFYFANKMCNPPIRSCLFQMLYKCTNGCHVPYLKFILFWLNYKMLRLDEISFYRIILN